MSPLTDDERDGLVEVLENAIRNDTDELAWDNLHSPWAVRSIAKSLADALTPTLEAHYEAGLVEGSMIGDADVREVCERGL